MRAPTHRTRDLSHGESILNSKEIRQNINKLLTDMQALAMAGFTAESRAKFDAMDRDVQSQEADAQRLESIESRTSIAPVVNRSHRPAGQPGAGVTPDAQSETRAAFKQFFRSGKAGLSMEQRDLVTTSDATGGALIPQLYDSTLYSAMKYYGPIAELLKRKVTDNSGAVIKIALVDDTENGLQLIDAEPSPAVGTSGGLIETDPGFTSKLLGVDTVSCGLVRVSVQELEDSNFDLDSLIRDQFAVRYARGLEKAVTLGVDTNGTTLPNNPGFAAALPVGTTTTVLANGIGWDDLTNLYGSLDPAYTNPQKAVWQFNSLTRSYLVGLKDGFGRPLFMPDPSDDAPFSRIMGFNVALNQALPNMGASAKPIIFGDPSTFMLRTDGAPSVVRLNERFMDTLEVGFFLYGRIGSTSLIRSGAPNGMTALQQAAS